MSRVRIEEPPHYPFNSQIPVRITDINYGGHVGNDSILSLIHEARMQFLRSLGYDELNLGGVSLIMADASIQFKEEAFYGSVIRAKVAVSDTTRAGFAIIYRLENAETNGLIALAKTGMVCFNYDLRKVAPLPEEVQKKFEVLMSSR